MKVALVVPNFRWAGSDKNTLWHYIPYNLCMLAAMVEDIADVRIIDAYKDNLSMAAFSMVLEKYNPDITGITVLFDQYGDSGHIAAREAKSLGCKTIMGGVYTMTNPDRVLKDENIDHMVLGEGEHALRDFVMRNGECGRIIKGKRIYDLDSLPLPSYHLLDAEKYFNSAERKSVDSPRAFPYARVMTSRGCPMNCCFCQVAEIAGREFRPRSAENVLSEIQWLKDNYGIKSLIFDDDNILHDKQRARDIFQGMIDRGIDMPWISIGLAAFKLDKELLYLMRKSGCEYIAVAIESGTERVLREIIKKPVNLEYADEMVWYARSLGIYVAANFIVGFPTETWDEIRQTIDFAGGLNADYIKLFHAVPLPHTRLYDLCVKEKAMGSNGHYVWSKGNIETKEFTANDLTILRAYEWDRINFSNPEKRKRTREMMGVTEAELDKVRKDTLKKACRLVGGS